MKTAAEHAGECLSGWADIWESRGPSLDAGKALVEHVTAAIGAAVAGERARCAAIVERHPDEKHPAMRVPFDPEPVRGCCEEMAARIRRGTFE